ncbi:hypothetical protein Bache_2805 [Bacteroides helcogenes P 36-108]|uniref:Uncharacterized protein n=1 Tax=Bacteroides helcogenes (strain ATCC 35417 / DSM 20613 / JCM 6297 / CCUG 15421 / P 36-108) TaxID=693979 RepID=E6SN94_BACT6|nr:hypothetical protein Bache_2805 [Bacteroides helcogenes P 36-108]
MRIYLGYVHTHGMEEKHIYDIFANAKYFMNTELCAVWEDLSRVFCLL